MTFPLSPQEPQRLDALAALLDLPSAAPDLRLEQIVCSVATVCETPIGLLTLIGREYQWIWTRHGLDVSIMPRGESVCTHTILQDGIFEVGDLLADERFRGNSHVQGGERLRFYAGAPLIFNGQRLGSLCVLDHRPRRLDAVQRELLLRMADRAVEVMGESAPLPILG